MVKFRMGNTRASKLTPVQVLEIRDKWASGQFSQAQLSRAYQVTITTIRNVIYGVTWQHLPPIIPQEQIALEAKVSQSRLPQAEPVKISEETQAKLLAELATLGDKPTAEKRSDPIEDYLNKGKGEGSNG
jgi:hypothetical protein